MTLPCFALFAITEMHFLKKFDAGKKDRAARDRPGKFQPLRSRIARAAFLTDATSSRG